MADRTELTLRIIPELDESAKRKVQDELDKITSSVPVKPSAGTGGKGGGTASTQAQTKAIKDQNIEYNAQGQIIGKLTAEHKEVVRAIDTHRKAQDLLLRSARTAAEGEIQALQQKAAVGQITMDEMNQGIIVQQQLIETAEASAREEFGYTTVALGHLGQAYESLQPQIVNAQTGVFHSTTRLNNGFNTMSGSMQKVVSQTKNANLAFMNFGRIVQDAPFGLIGIANNIDPLIVTFSNLSNEIDATTGKMRGFGGAMSQLGKQLLGPAGIIFILGSLIPSALLLIQSRQRDAAKESDHLAEALKRVADEFGRLSGEAASQRGLAQVNTELENTTQNLALVSEELNRIEDQINTAAALEAINQQGSVNRKTQGQIRKELEAQNSEILKQLRGSKTVLETQKTNLESQREEIEARKIIGDLQRENGIAESLSLSDRIKKSRELLGLQMKGLEIVDSVSAEISKEQDRIRGVMVQMITNAEFMATDAGKKMYNDLRDRLAKVADEIRAKQQDTEEAIKESDERIYKSREELVAAYRKYVQNDLLNRLDAEEMTMRQLMESEFTTDEERLRIFQRFQEQKTAVLDEYVNKQREIQRKAEEQEAKAQADAVSRFVQQQQQILDASNERLIGRNDLLLTYYENTNQEVLAIEQRSLMQLFDLRETYAKLGLLQTEEYKLAEQSIRDATAREVAATEIEQMQLIAGAIGASFEAIFGENKMLSTAMVVVDTIMGMQKAIALNPPPSPMGAIIAAGIAAKGAAAIKKINSAKRGSAKVGGGEAGSSTNVVRESNYSAFGAAEGKRLPVGNEQMPSGRDVKDIRLSDAVRRIFGKDADRIEADINMKRQAFFAEQERQLLEHSSRQYNIMQGAMSMANDVASTLSDRSLEMTQPISVQANVDRRGIAIAVREGEMELRTSEFTYN